MVGDDADIAPRWPDDDIAMTADRSVAVTLPPVPLPGLSIPPRGVVVVLETSRGRRRRAWWRGMA
ncbi:hypothetical protein [Sphingomonas sp. 8AM]|uniref:hypothetical protein n=1 Tax=Sphingomonas sp. 8AM TaxID=2653170 RepID=UPI0012F0C8F8|nr:hypothetical protein [Sphingomonas sp. 8AM]VXD00561.1 hypothetical protein SPHINGO8AM_70211 [Sphingomonas sp. 8AM]